MKSRLCLFVAASLSLNVANAAQVQCGYHMTSQSPRYINPTFEHQVDLDAGEATIVYQTTLWASIHTFNVVGCSFWSSTPTQWEATGPPVNQWIAWIKGPLPEMCSGAIYQFEGIRWFKVYYFYQDPTDLFGGWFAYDGIWPSEGFECPQGAVWGTLTNL